MTRAPSSGRSSLGDAHVHLSYGSADALEQLLAAGGTVVRDCGGDFQQIDGWRREIAAGRLRGPKVYLSGPMLDGPKEDAQFRLTVETPGQAEQAVDTLANMGVDFVKTHNAVPPDAFFAAVRRARAHGLKVAAHLPRGVPAWVAAERGVASIEHAAESLVASPIYAGFATDPAAAIKWWQSPAGDAAVQQLARSGVTIVPTLVRYEASIGAATSAELRTARAGLMPQLLEIVGRLHRAGVPILVGSDLVGLEGAPPPEAGPAREVQLLEAAGLSLDAARAAGSAEAIEQWFRKP